MNILPNYILPIELLQIDILPVGILPINILPNDTLPVKILQIDIVPIGTERYSTNPDSADRHSTSRVLPVLLFPMKHKVRSNQSLLFINVQSITMKIFR